ncbi:NAD(P)/FAD-dependent oxidoreductase [Candidatus Woesearchaeota archaeon]|nr:NAD(P)/FAD-dependent oxidoreductase [Candidatus Woesearchaeota archaeon]MCF7900668.1 NAD(P)/FAD-dependent oxidoreductase [Candidatus Woesearchaeota archaeon]MCF8013497.1 NAD(P)/FAD-dependent oxidoreductase [Candidatus Woesearchaeota archaeon]
MTTIIGAGGAGLNFAKQWKDKNPEDEAIIIEEHIKRGLPIQCTGILTNEIDTLLPKKILDKITLNKITQTKVFSPNNSTLIKISSDRIICNKTFIELLHEKAEKSGVKIKEGYKYIDNKGSTIKIRNTQSQKITEIKDQKLVGADGPTSNVAKNNLIYSKRNFLTGVQARVKIKDLKKEQIDFYPYIGRYAWAVPESDEIARIGVATSKNAKKLFDDFIKKYPGKIIEMQGGPIPLHKSNTHVINKQKNVALIGDSALQIKNTTGGGIVAGIKAGNVLSKGFEKYEKNLKELNKELKIHYYIDKVLQKYSDKDWDILIKKVNNPKIKEILLTKNRDNAVKLINELAKQPNMISEGIKAIWKLV